MRTRSPKAARRVGTRRGQHATPLKTTLTGPSIASVLPPFLFPSTFFLFLFHCFSSIAPRLPPNLSSNPSASPPSRQNHAVLTTRYFPKPRYLLTLAAEVAEEGGRRLADDVLLEVAGARVGRRGAGAERVGVLDLVAGFTGAADEGALGSDVARNSEDSDGDEVLRTMSVCYIILSRVCETYLHSA